MQRSSICLSFVAALFLASTAVAQLSPSPQPPIPRPDPVEPPARDALAAIGATERFIVPAEVTIHGVRARAECDIDFAGGLASCSFRSYPDEQVQFALDVPGRAEMLNRGLVRFTADYVDASLVFRIDRTRRQLVFVPELSSGRHDMTWDTPLRLQDAKPAPSRIRPNGEVRLLQGQR